MPEMTIQENSQIVGGLAAVLTGPVVLGPGMPQLDAWWNDGLVPPGPPDGLGVG